MSKMLVVEERNLALVVAVVQQDLVLRLVLLRHNSRKRLSGLELNAIIKLLIAKKKQMAHI